MILGFIDLCDDVDLAEEADVLAGAFMEDGAGERNENTGCDSARLRRAEEASDEDERGKYLVLSGVS